MKRILFLTLLVILFAFNSYAEGPKIFGGSGSGVSNIVEDTTPQLGGDLDLNGKNVKDATGRNDDDCTGNQGYLWWDSTDSHWEFCDANSGTPISFDLYTLITSINTATKLATVSNSGSYFATAFASGITSEALFKAAVNLEAGTDFLAPNGDGSALTNVDAATGDSATAFFDAGTIEHERGGLEANVAAYDGLVWITGGATANATSGADLETALGLGAFASDLLGYSNAAAVLAGIGAEGDLANSAGLAGALSDETGSGVSVFGTSPTFTTSTLLTNTLDMRVATTTTAHEWSIQIYDNDDVTWRDALNFANGDTPTITAGAVTFDFTGATAVNLGPIDAGNGVLEIPNGTNPTVDADGEIAYETDEEGIRVYDGAANRLIGTVITQSYPILQPDLVQAETDDVQIFHFDARWYPFGVKMLGYTISTSASSSDTYLLEEWDDAVGSTQSTSESIALSTATREEDDGTLSDSDFAADSFLNVNLDDSQDDISLAMITFAFYVKTGD